MANANLQITPAAGAPVESYELNFSSLYLHHTYAGSKPNQSRLIEANGATSLGTMDVQNWTIYDGPGPNASLVARAQGLHIFAGNWFSTFSIEFEHERFRGSSLQVMGNRVESGDWAIVGGTGEFAMATGVIKKRRHEQKQDGDIIELTVHGFCRGLYLQGLLTKIGTWGGNGGAAHDIVDPPRRLQSITVFSGDVVDSIAFSYVDKAGQNRSAGPWGGPGGRRNTIQLSCSEFVKEVSGTVGSYGAATVIKSLKIVTNVNTYGPFGQGRDNPFSIPVQSNGSVVGFYGRGGKYLDAIGVYVHPF